MRLADLPLPILTLLQDFALQDEWCLFARFCQDNECRVKDKWLAFFWLQVQMQRLTLDDVEAHFDSVALAVFHHVDWLAQRIEKQPLNACKRNIVNFRKLILRSLKKPRAMMIYLVTLYYRMRQGDPVLTSTERAWALLQLVGPLCRTLNLGFIRWRLEDEAFKWGMPEVYNHMRQALGNQQSMAQQACQSLRHLLIRERLSFVSIRHRVKHLWGIYKKCQRQQCQLQDVHDQLGLRIISYDEQDCYQILRVLQHHYPQIDGSFKDYIKNPKDNGYQSLHSAFYWQNHVIEVQMRTEKMHHFNQYGPAAHWLYKDQQYFGDKLKHLVKQEPLLVVSGIFLLTPLGDVVQLQEGARPLDFAYRIHTEMGHCCQGVRLNGQLAQLTDPLRNGDTVEIITGNQRQVQAYWLTQAYSRTESARRQIRLALKQSAQTCINPVLWSQCLATQPNFAPWFRLARCCQPSVDDAIVGYITRSRGMTVHAARCAQVSLSSRHSHCLVPLLWQDIEDHYYFVCCLGSMLSGRRVREQVMRLLRHHLVYADWYSDPQTEELAKLRCTLRFKSRQCFVTLQDRMSAQVGVLSFEPMG